MRHCRGTGGCPGTAEPRGAAGLREAACGRRTAAASADAAAAAVRGAAAARGAAGADCRGRAIPRPGPFREPDRSPGPFREPDRSPDPFPEPDREAGVCLAGTRRVAAGPGSSRRFVRSLANGLRSEGRMVLPGVLAVPGRPAAPRRRRTPEAWATRRIPARGRPGGCRAGRPVNTRSSGPARSPGVRASHRHGRAGRRRAAERCPRPAPGPPGGTWRRGAGDRRIGGGSSAGSG
jgi:hypothetical protein